MIYVLSLEVRDGYLQNAASSDVGGQVRRSNTEGIGAEDAMFAAVKWMSSYFEGRRGPIQIFTRQRSLSLLASLRIEKEENHTVG
ncbi:hypothetical protein Hypma_002168 [Hypsizygus marmoreus]|uniref:Uncharacterized protein n=1 Tax=Hypsizygus marmoreus TaxID=39966 RepID=A0A369K7X9_HYPMA|nr:hypothetical protein Hypma_002168 [Hypsizygus marmoreus]